MESVLIQFVREPHDLPLPAYQTDQASGLDLCAAIEAPLTLCPGKREVIPTGFAIALPDGYEAQVRPRSSLAVNDGITVLNTPGTIDADYRGELKVNLINLGSYPHIVKRGDRIAQLVIAPVVHARLTEVAELPKTARDTGGHGSTDHSGGNDESNDTNIPLK